MKIQLDDKHYLNSDQYCYWVTVRYETKKGSEGERRCSGYTTTFEDAVSSFIEKKVLSSEAEKYEDLVKEIEALKAEVKSWGAAVPKER